MGTTSQSLIFFDSGDGTGAVNMDTDLAIANDVMHGKYPGVLRFYGWHPWCISLGKNQGAETLNLDLCRQDGIDVVHRPTGGRAVFHAEELTYSIIVPPYRGLDVTFQMVSECLMEGLHSLGVEAVIESNSPDLKDWYSRPSSTLCFSTATRNEIRVAGKKLVGSAQRLMGNVILQHGSILIGPAHKRIVNYLHLDKETEGMMRITMDQKTTCLSEWGIRDSEPVKSALLASFSAKFSVHRPTSRLPVA